VSFAFSFVLDALLTKALSTAPMMERSLLNKKHYPMHECLLSIKTLGVLLPWFGVIRVF
jgi:hypothetical protein